MDFESPTTLATYGFVGGMSVAQLQMSCAIVPRERGVYLVLRRSASSVRFLNRSTGGHFKGRDPSVPIAVLQERWIPHAKVLYIGKAGGAAQKATLHSRIRTYMRFGLGHRCAHQGGRYIWQLCDAGDLLVYWSATLDLEPRQVESALLNKFVKKYGHLPFANLIS